tara:strand:+ start:146 stop:859 length:714 start_codon:yes stop_codon:yes gene_type:complete
VNLDNYASKYFSDPSAEIENFLIMNEYPKIIARNVGHVGSILELGIGHGYTLPLFENMCDTHSVIEGSKKVIDNFKMNKPLSKSHIYNCLFENFDVDQKYDLIIMGFILEHVDNPVELLSKYKQLLNVDGKMFVAVPNAKSMNRRIGLELGMIPNIYDLNETDHELGHLRNYCPTTLKADIENAGLVLEKINGIYLKPLPLTVLKSLDQFEDNMAALVTLGYEFPELSVAIMAEICN